jgi:hypothetical protein
VSDAELRELERAARHDPDAAARLAQAYRRRGLGWHGEPLARTSAGLVCVPTDEPGVYEVALPWGPKLEMVHVPPDAVDEDEANLSFQFSARARGYYLGRYPMTWAQVHGSPVRIPRPPWFPPASLLRRLRRAPDPPPSADRGLHPVVNATHDDADQLLAAAGLRLPTISEWRRAAKLGGGPWPWGSEPPDPDRAVLAEHPACGGRTTAPVARLDDRRLVPARPAGASATGACDMVGNVEELTSDEATIGRSFMTPTAAAGDYLENAQWRGPRQPFVGFRAALDARPRPLRY